MSAPDPKPVRTRQRARRVVDRPAVRAARWRTNECAACGRPCTNSHHVLPKAQGGDDVDANLIRVCGSGAHGCHGGLHGIPYVDGRGRRWTPEEVKRRTGEFLARDRPDTIRYVLEKLGEEPGRDYLRRRYLLELP